MVGGGDVFRIQANDPVVGFQTDLLQRLEDPGGDPLIATPVDHARRAAGVRDPFAGSTEHRDLDELVEHDPVTDAWL